MKPRCQKCSAFTLLELILVMVILAIVAGLIVPSLRAFGVGRGNNNMATLIVSLTGYARTQAVTQSRTYRLNFDVASQAVWLTFDDGGTFDAPSGDFGQKFPMTDGVQMRTDAPTHQDGQYVEFHPTGRTDAANIWLTDKLGGEIEIGCPSSTEMFHVLPPDEVTK